MPGIWQIKKRRDTASNWASTNPILAAGEMGYESDTRKEKVGDGVTAWNSLLYAYPSADFSGTALVIGKTTGDYPVSRYTATTSKSAFDLALEAALAAGNKVIIRNSSTPYTMRQAIKADDNKWIEGESKDGVTLQLENARNVSMVVSAKTTNTRVENFTMKNIILDHNGQNQTGGGGIVIAGLRTSLFEDVRVVNSFRFCVLIQGVTPTANLTGTLTFTTGSELVSGSGTAFTTELTKGAVIKDNTNGYFGRVAEIISDTQIRLTDVWSFATLSAVAVKNIPPNDRNVWRRFSAHGTIDNRDNIGLGIADYNILEDCYSENASGAGCGFVPDHAKGVVFINCVAANNGNAGFSYETCEDTQTYSCTAYGAKTGNGFQLISGGINNVVSGFISYNNFQHGFAINNNNTSFPNPKRNKFIGITAYDNGGAGFRNDGAIKTTLQGADLYNNTTGGYIQNTAAGIVPLDTKLINVNCYDARATKVQARGIWLVTGINTVLENCTAEDSDHVTQGITDTATNTSILYFKNGNIGVNNKNPGNKLNVNTPTTAVANRDAVFASSAAANIPFAVMAAPSQTGNLLELLSSAGNIIANVTAGGLFRTATSAVTTPAYSFASEGGTGMGRIAGQANTLFLSTAAIARMIIDTNKTQFTHGMQFVRTPVGNVNYTILASDYYIGYTSLTASRTATLPTAASVAGQTYVISDESGSASSSVAIIIATSNSETINGASTTSITSAYGSCRVYSTGTAWIAQVPPTASSGSGLPDTGTNGMVARTAANTTAARTITGTTNLINITNGDGVAGNPTITVGSNVTTNSGAATLASKRITRRVTTLAAGTSYTPLGDTSDEVIFGIPTGNFAVNAPFGTPQNGDIKVFRMLTGANPYLATWNSIYVAGNALQLPGIFPASSTVNLVFKYDSTLVKWVLLASDMPQTIYVPAQILAYRRVTAATTITSADGVISFDATSAAITQPLPDPATIAGRILVFKKWNTNSNSISLTGYNVDGVAGYTLSGTTKVSVTLVATAAGYEII